ncbi:MAG: long-chain-fatty-acid--CoA ligase [Acidimicrobiia bacterium]
MGRITGSLEILFTDPVLRATRAAWYRSWRETGAFRGETLLEVIERAAIDDPDARVVFGSEVRPGEVRLGDLPDRARAAAGAFAASGVGRGDVVAVQLPNWPVTIDAYLGAVAVGAVLVPIVHTYGPAETGWILEASGASTLVCPDRWGAIDFHARLDAIPWARGGRTVMVGDDVWPGAVSWSALVDASAGPVDPVPVDPDDPLLVVYTSGTTADPKGVVHSHETFVAELFRMTQAPPERRDWVVMQPWPAGHVAGLLAILSPAITRSTTILVDRWDVVTCSDLIEEHRPIAITGAPIHLSELLTRVEAGELDASSIRYAVTGGTAVPPVLVERAQQAGWSVTRSYGSSEHPQATATSFDDDLDVRIHTDGTPIRDTEVRVVDPSGSDLPVGVPGEVLLRGPQQFLGYTDPALNETAFDRDGWFHSGDIGSLDADGRLTITDRLKDIIIRGGENLSSMEIEGIALRHPGIGDAAAIGVPDARYGERVGLVVVPTPGCERITVDALRAFFASAGVARMKAPELVALVDELPRNASGKVMKHVLRDTVDFGAPA